MVLFLATSISCVKIYTSIGQSEADKSFLQFVQNRPNVVLNDMSYCLRFNLKRFKDNIVFIKRDDFIATLKPQKKGTWIKFGLQSSNTQLLSSIMKVNGSFELWKVHNWHHFCLSYDNNRQRISIVKVRVLYAIFVFVKRYCNAIFVSRMGD